eukprot:3076693-Pleurochrysis_carterae.AAC.1
MCARACPHFACLIPSFVAPFTLRRVFGKLRKDWRAEADDKHFILQSETRFDAPVLVLPPNTPSSVDAFPIPAGADAHSS